MDLLFLPILIGLIPAIIAHGKGRSFILWWIYGAGLFIVALPHSLIMKIDQKSIENQRLSEDMKRCPYCAELIKKEAIVCRYCNRNLATKDAKQKLEVIAEKNKLNTKNTDLPLETKIVFWILLSLIFIVLILLNIEP